MFNKKKNFLIFSYFLFVCIVEEEEDDEAVSEDETDEEMYQEKNVRLKNEFIEDSYAIEEEIGR